MRIRMLTLGVIVVLALAACSGKSHDAAPTTRPASSTTADTSSAANPDVIPPVITVAYVNAVFAVLNHINGNAVRALVASKRVTPTVELYLRAAYNDPLYQQEVKIAQQSISGNLNNVRRPPGDIVTSVQRLIAVSPSCVFAETRSNFTNVLIQPGPPAGAEYFSLTPKKDGIDPKHLNPTDWAFTFNADYQNPTRIPSQCAAS
jgi:hypothetical protein